MSAVTKIARIARELTRPLPIIDRLAISHRLSLAPRLIVGRDPSLVAPMIIVQQMACR
jgi:hypothetical protein